MPLLQGSARPATGLNRGLRGLGNMVIAAAAVAIAAIVIEKVTEASLPSEVARHQAARMFAPYNAYFYSRSPQTASVSDQFLVVNLGQATLDHYKTAWPMSYGHHARILERIRRGQPKALFVDFQFQAARDDPSLTALMDVLCAYKADGIPIFLAAGSAGGDDKLRPEIEDLRDTKGQRCFEKVSVGYTASGPDNIAWTYPLRSNESGQPSRSAALAMAEAFRGDTLSVNDEHFIMGLDWASSDRHIGPSWSATAPSRHAKGPPAAASANGTGAATEDAPAKHYCRAPSITDIIPLQAFVGQLRGQAPDVRPACPLHESIEAAWLTAGKSEDQFKALDRQLKRRAVFYGGSFDAGDIVNSPLHGEIPGVYLHAQAADNLARHGNDWQHPEITGRLNNWPEWLMLFLSFFVIALLLIFGREGLLFLWDQGPLRLWQKLTQTPQGLQLGKLGRRSAHRVRQWGRQLSHTLVAAFPQRYWGWLPRLLASLNHELANLATKLGYFYLSLVMVVPISLLLERALHVSVIGYSNVLAFCLLGEVFAATAHAQGTSKRQSH